MSTRMNRPILIMAILDAVLLAALLAPGLYFLSVSDNPDAHAMAVAVLWIGAAAAGVAILAGWVAWGLWHLSGWVFRVALLAMLLPLGLGGCAALPMVLGGVAGALTIAKDVAGLDTQIIDLRTALRASPTAQCAVPGVVSGQP